MRVLLWQDWVTRDGRYLFGGYEAEVAASEGAAICRTGAGEVIRDVGVEIAVGGKREKAVKRTRGR